MTKIQRALVVGAGTMGRGVAQLCAACGLDTYLYDVSPSQREEARQSIEASLAKAVAKAKLSTGARDEALARLVFVEDLSDARMDVAIEAVPEKMDLKKSVLQSLAETNPQAILATNTSSLSVTEIAAAVPNPGVVVGLHFFNPPPIMPLLEVVRAEQTAEEVVQECLRLAERLNKTPVIVKDRPGFATSRLGIALGLEAIRMVESGVASVADIDTAMQLGYRHPMGPLELTDWVGLDVRLAIAEHLTKELGPRFQAPPLLRQLVRAGKLGRKTGEGFYRWKDGKPVRPEKEH